MDKNAIKKYAVWARRELIDRVTKRAAVYGVTADGFGDVNADTVNGHLLSGAEKRQRQALIHRIRAKDYEQVMEEVAYTWFNRFAALRFMEVNGYLPSHIRVFTDDEGRFRPQILAEAIHLELDGLNMERVYQLKDANQEEELFKYLLIVQCNALNSILPGMFQKIEDYTELLLPDYLLREGSVIEQMITLIPEDDWKDQVQIIGWLYQYYNTEPKDKVFADLKKNIKISKEKIPAATQLFTPDWIVHYMVENSLGRLWLEGHPNAELKSEWKYYLDEAEQEPEVQEQLAEIRKQYAALKPEEILAIDHCAGSGHILCVLFDVLVRIYEDYGYTAREAAVSIVQNNLWGLDIDDRAAQLAYFAVMMKARQYDRRFFSKGVQPHVYAIQESNGITSAPLHDMGIDLSQEEYASSVKQVMQLIDDFHDATEYGSIITPAEADWDLLRRFAVPRWESSGQQIPMNIHGEVEAAPRLQALINVGQALSQKYHVVVTNPPYMGASSMGDKLATYVKNNYPDTKSDMSTVCMERCLSMCSDHGMMAMINIPVWMFLSSYEKLRSTIIRNNTFIAMAHLGRGIFGSDFGTTAFVLKKTLIRNYTSVYRRLFHKSVEVESSEEREMQFLSGRGLFYAQQEAFLKIPGYQIAYWINPHAIELFSKHKPLGKKFELKQGLITANNDLFLRFWYEPTIETVSVPLLTSEAFSAHNKTWLPYNKGGDFRKWYGNYDLVVNWKDNGASIKGYKDERGKVLSRPQNIQYFFKEGATWTLISSGSFSIRYCPPGFGFDARGSMLFGERSKEVLYAIALLNSCVSSYYLAFLSPTITFEVGNVSKVPYVYDETTVDEVVSKVKTLISISKNDWDSFETSWDFQRHPLVIHAIDQHYLCLADCWREWEQACNERFAQLKANEEELNRIFIEIYGLQDELTPEVDDKDVTVRKADLGRDIRSLISYAVGCMLGRYSLDEPGLAFAGGNWQEWLAQQDAMTYAPDKDGILPITDDEYFYDDIVTIFVDWVKTVYGAATLEENLTFIANALGGKGSPREVIREYFLNDFYKDHLKIYQKRPIYWLFDSGKKNGFKALVYMHRWQPDTIARVRTDYVHEMQSRYRTAIADVEQRINGASTSERVKLTKRLTALQAQAEELRKYEEKVHHLADQMIGIDLDDGVKVNYAKFADVLAPIK